MKRQILSIGLILLVFACSSPDTRVETTIEVPVEVAELSKKPIEEFVETTGTVSAAKEAVLQSEAQGYYRLAENPATGKPYVLGDRVTKGQTIIYMDNPEQIATIKLESYRLNYENSQRDYEKQKSLYDKGGVTLMDLKSAERSYVDAKYSYDNAKIQTEKLKITAPFTGVIVDLPYYTAGVKVASNTEIVQLMNYDVLKMDVNIPDRLLGKITPGQKVRVMNYKDPDKKLNAVISQVSPALNSDTRTFKASLDIDNGGLSLRPGMFVKAEIVTARKDSALVIPKEIIMTRQNNKIVYIVERGFARERRVTTGLENPTEVEIVKGLKMDDRLIVKGYETLVNGTRVRITQ